MEKVNDKIGNVRLFKKHLRKQGLIGNRQQFSEEHVNLFEEIRRYKRANHTTWESAFKVGLNSILKEKGLQFSPRALIAESKEDKIEYTLNEILKTLQRIESKLNNGS